MNNVEFPEEQSFINASAAKQGGRIQKPRGLFGMVIRSGLAKDETGALVILAAAGLLALILAGAVLFVAL